MKDRTSESYVSAYRFGISYFRNLGNVIGIMRLDNETSDEVETFFKDELHLDYQLSPPTNHRANVGEKAIRTAKNHLISVLANAHPDSPAYLWELYLVQSAITLNHMLPYKPDPSKSAYHGIHGSRFDLKNIQLHLLVVRR
jgi:hypothetical protein